MYTLCHAPPAFHPGPAPFRLCLCALFVFAVLSETGKITTMHNSVNGIERAPRLRVIYNTSVHHCSYISYKVACVCKVASRILLKRELESWLVSRRKAPGVDRPWPKIANGAQNQQMDFGGFDYVSAAATAAAAALTHLCLPLLQFARRESKEESLARIRSQPPVYLTAWENQVKGKGNLSTSDKCDL